MRLRLRAFSLLRWCVTAGTLLVLAASALSMRYHFGVIRTVPYPGGYYAPNHTTVLVTHGGFLYIEGQGATDVGRDSPYVVLGVHWQWYRIPPGYPTPRWKTTLELGWMEVPPWLLVGPPVALTLGLWMPVVVRRIRRKGYECACGYDRRGLGAAAPCPECGAVPPRVAMPGG